jgi:hypothetical protein
MNELLPTIEVADLLKTTPGTLRRWRKAGEGPPCVIMHAGPNRQTIRYPRERLNAWLEARMEERLEDRLTDAASR